MLLLVTFITLHYATPWQAVALWYAMLRYDLLYYVTVYLGQMLQSSSVLLRFDLSKVIHLTRYVSIRCLL